MHAALVQYVHALRTHYDTVIQCCITLLQPDLLQEEWAGSYLALKIWNCSWSHRMPCYLNVATARSLHQSCLSMLNICKVKERTVSSLLVYITVLSLLFLSPPASPPYIPLPLHCPFPFPFAPYSVLFHAPCPSPISTSSPCFWSHIVEMTGNYCRDYWRLLELMEITAKLFNYHLLERSLCISFISVFLWLSKATHTPFCYLCPMFT